MSRAQKLLTFIVSRSSFFSRKRVVQRTLFVIGVPIVILGFVWALFFRLFTNLAPNFSPQQFESVEVGEGFASVTNRLGLPLRAIAYDSGGVAFDLKVHDPHFSSDLSAAAHSPSNLVLLFYSEPNWVDDYMRYYLFIKDGKVIEKRSYWYWD